TAKRMDSLPDVPTVAESGVPSYEMVLWSGLFAPAGTPPDIVKKLQTAVQDAMNSAEMKDRLKGLGVEPIGSTSEELAKVMKKQISQYTKVAKQAGIVIN